MATELQFSVRCVACGEEDYFNNNDELGMYAGLEKVIHDHIVDGVLSIPTGMQHALQVSVFPETRNMLPTGSMQMVRVMEGAANNLPDEAAQSAAHAVREVVKKVGVDDLLIVLVSGGGSALLPAPVPGITLADKLSAVRLISAAGGAIHDLNTVRKKLSELKGGKLVEMCASSNIITLMLSDIVNDPIDLIASGPTVVDTSTFTDCLRIFERLDITSKLPDSVLAYVRSHASNEANVKVSRSRTESCSGRVQNIIVGSNRTAVQAAAQTAAELGFSPVMLSCSVTGEARVIGNIFAHLLMSLMAKNDTRDQLNEALSNLGVRDVDAVLSFARANGKLCFISGGESTVVVRGTGKGGRNQEMVLAFLSSLVSRDAVKAGFAGMQFCFLSAGTDGQDGPTDASGAFCTNDCLSACIGGCLDPLAFLQDNNSYEFFSSLESGKFLYKTGLTGTNVMDLQVLLVQNSFPGLIQP